MRSTLRSIRNNRRLDLSLVVTGMHLSREFGSTIGEIRKDGFPISAELPTLMREDTPAGMVRSFAKCANLLTSTFEELDPDIVLVLGDRWEMLAAAIAASYMNIVVAHVDGGEVTGSIDESNRHAITRFAHVHLVATRNNAMNLIRMGEERDRIHVVGAPSLDDIMDKAYTCRHTVRKRFGLTSEERHALLVQHAVVTEYSEAPKQIAMTLDALREAEIRTIGICPNADAGGRAMIEVMKRYESRGNLRLYKNLSRDDYLGLMASVDVMVGNSSSGIVEAPSFHLPSVNIGMRQQGRVRAKSTIDVGNDRDEIAAAIRRSLSRPFKRRSARCSNPYGDGRTGPRIAKILSQTEPTTTLLQKRLSYSL
jgi:UDP-N-acetylglucosamine 2-epimerase (non-hydrolysing)/GDP/UDP-N,N'-diacetylbacillosamine 2-epimerase (hydrolysing)